MAQRRKVDEKVRAQGIMRLVTISREKKFLHCLSVFQVSCDGEVVATVRNGQEVTFKVNESSHRIQCFYSHAGETGVKMYYSDLIYVQEGVTNIKIMVRAGIGSIKAWMIDPSTFKG